MRIALITPALQAANNGNWQTAQRWAAFLSVTHAVDLASTVIDLPLALATYDAMIALHARRSADPVARFAEQCPHKPLIVVLTGTDLYRDIATDTSAQQSLQLAGTLVVLQSAGLKHLPPALQAKARVIVQSSPRAEHLAHSEQHLRVCVVGHLRAEKSPETVFAVAAALTQHKSNIHISQAGKALKPQFEAQAKHTQVSCPNHYTWLGSLSHAESTALIARSDVLFHPSQLEGGSLTIIEAVQSGTAVIASRVDGHIGLLGDDYLGYFEWGDANGAAQLLMRCAQDLEFMNTLLNQCQQRSALFDPETERQAVLNLLTIKF